MIPDSTMDVEVAEPLERFNGQSVELKRDTDPYRDRRGQRARTRKQ
jgi:hypothetical protein